MKKKILQLAILASLSAISFNSMAQSSYATYSATPHVYGGGEYLGWDGTNHGPLNFQTYGVQRMTILDNGTALTDGNVGIGNSFTNPTSRLDVYDGDINIGRTGTTDNNGYRIGGATGQGYYVLWHNGNNGNIFVGANAGNANAAPGDAYSTFCGAYAGNHVTYGAYLSGIGSNNSFFGKSAGYSVTIGHTNTITGTEAGWDITTGISNTISGYQAGGGAYTTSGMPPLSDQRWNTITGYRAGYWAAGVSGQEISWSNCFYGKEAGFNHVDGAGNVLVGNHAGWGQTQTNGGEHYNSNTFVGGVAGFNWGLGTVIDDTTSASKNVALGAWAAYNMRGGTNNLYLGFGAQANPTATTRSYSAAIGANADVENDYQMIIGDNDPVNENGHVENVAIGYSRFGLPTTLAQFSVLEHWQNATPALTSTLPNPYPVLPAMTQAANFSNTDDATTTDGIEVDVDGPNTVPFAKGIIVNVGPVNNNVADGVGIHTHVVAQGTAIGHNLAIVSTGGYAIGQQSHVASTGGNATGASIVANAGGGSTNANGVIGYAANGGQNNIGVTGIANTVGTGVTYGVVATVPGNSGCTVTPPISNWCAAGAQAAVLGNGDIVTTSGNYFASDSTLKDSIQALSGADAMSIINNLNPKTYIFKIDSFPSVALPFGHHYGLIAQEVATILPHLVDSFIVPSPTDSLGNPDTTVAPVPFLGLNYTELIPILIGGMQEQQAMIDSLHGVSPGTCEAPDTLHADLATELNGRNIYYDGQHDNSGWNSYDAMGMGYSCGDTLPGKLSVNQNDSATDATVALYAHNGDVTNFGVFDKTAVYGNSDGVASGDGGTNIGGDFEGLNNLNFNIGVRGRAGRNSTTAGYENYGGDFEATGGYYTYGINVNASGATGKNDGADIIATGGGYTEGLNIMSSGAGASNIGAEITVSGDTLTSNGGIEATVSGGSYDIGLYGVASNATGENDGAGAYAYGGDFAYALGAGADFGNIDNVGIYAHTFAGGGSGINYAVYASAPIGPCDTTGCSNAAVFADGDLAYTGNSYQVSDARLKTGVRALDSALATIKKLSPKYYSFDTKDFPGVCLPQIPNQMGFLAQDLQAIGLGGLVKSFKVLPPPDTAHLIPNPNDSAKHINHNANGHSDSPGAAEILAVNYVSFIPLIVGALNEKIAADSIQNQNLQNKLDSMGNVLNQLNQLIQNCCQSQGMRNSNPNGGGNGNDNSNGSGTVTLTISDESNTAILGQNIPNPANGSTIIPFRIPQNCNSATIVITEVETGKLVNAIPVSCKETNLSIEAGSIATGAYAYTLYIDGKLIDTKKMVLTK